MATPSPPTLAPARWTRRPLAAVMDVLDGLQRGGRPIGVVDHVEESAPVPPPGRRSPSAGRARGSSAETGGAARRHARLQSPGAAQLGRSPADRRSGRRDGAALGVDGERAVLEPLALTPPATGRGSSTG